MAGLTLPSGAQRAHALWAVRPRPLGVPAGIQTGGDRVWEPALKAVVPAECPAVAKTAKPMATRLQELQKCFLVSRGLLSVFK